MNAEGVGTLDELKKKMEERRGGPWKADVVMTPQNPRTDSTAGADTKPSLAGTLIQERQDSSPIKPLSSILNVQRLTETPHTREQVEALWTAYHASRSNGTGRGYLSAVVPTDVYQTMIRKGRQYGMFVLPLPRSTDETSAEGTATEFFVMEWGFHEPPRHHSRPDTGTGFIQNETLAGRTNADTGKNSNLPPTTILFTPLQEYKLRQSFAQPYLVLTFYPDLAISHGVILLRGEITPATNGGYLLGQVDAQMLALGVQKFYLPKNGGEGRENEAEVLLRTFHEEPEKFDWQTLLRVADLGVGR
jgi:ATP synthase F1 complex assembly factor 1